MLDNLHNFNNVDQRVIKNYNHIQFLYKASRSDKTFSDWIEQYPLFMKYIDQAHTNNHPMDYERAQLAQKALIEFDKKNAQ